MNSTKSRSRKIALYSLAWVAVLAGCGGGGDDEAGSLTAFSASPTTLTMTALAPTAGGPPAGQCVAGYGGEIFIYGGAAPYRLDNAFPDAVVLNKTEVSDRGGSFSVGFTGRCVSPALIVVVDKLDRQITVTLNNNPQAAPAAPAPPASGASAPGG